MPSQDLPPGKLPLDLLDDLLGRIAYDDPRVVVGPTVGEDAAVIDFGDTCLVAKTDPITFATDEIGYYAIHVSANDIATMGATPRWFLPTVLLPERGSDEKIVRDVFASIADAASDAGIAICGGHTEVTVGLDRPIVVGQMLGEVARDDLIRSDGLVEGDHIILTKGLAIEGTAILAREKSDALADRGVDSRLVAHAARFLHDPGISVLPEARIACDVVRPHAMHDPTEGGVATALRELAAASSVGLSVDTESLFLLEESRVICDALDVDPLGLISSGALLIGVAVQEAAPLLDALRDAAIRSEVIATVTAAEAGLRCASGEDFPSFQRDEIARIFAA